MQPPRTRRTNLNEVRAAYLALVQGETEKAQEILKGIIEGESPRFDPETRSSYRDVPRVGVSAYKRTDPWRGYKKSRILFGEE